MKIKIHFDVGVSSIQIYPYIMAASTFQAKPVRCKSICVQGVYKCTIFVYYICIGA